MDKSSESLSPESKARSWRASNCSCADYDSLDSFELRKLIVGPYEAYVNAKLCPVFVPIDPINLYKSIIVANESHMSIETEFQGSQKPEHDQNGNLEQENNVKLVDVIKKNLPENKDQKTVRLETDTKLSNDDKDKIEIKDLIVTSKKYGKEFKEIKLNETITLSHNLEETLPDDNRQSNCHVKSSTASKFGKDKKEETTDNSLKQIYCASVTQRDNSNKTRSEHHLKCKGSIKVKDICSHKDCKTTEDRNATDDNLGAFKKDENKVFDAPYTEDNIAKVTKPCKLQSNKPSKVTSKIQEILTTKEANMHHNDSLVDSNKCFEEKTTKNMCYKNRNNEFEKKYGNSTSLNVCPLNKVIPDVKTIGENEYCKTCDKKTLIYMPEVTKYDKLKLDDALDHNYVCLKPGKNLEIANDTKARPQKSIKGELDYIYTKPRCGLNNEIIKLSEPRLKENKAQHGYEVFPKHNNKSEIKNLGKLLLKEKIEAGSHPTCRKHCKHPDVTKLNINRADGQTCPKHQLTSNSGPADQHKYDNTPVKKYKKFCPAYCPICHKLYIEEQNDELLKKTRVPFKECRKCQEEQNNKKPRDNICSDKNVMQTPYRSNDSVERENVYSAAYQNWSQDAKNKICSAECYVPTGQNNVSKSKDIRHDLITCDDVYTIENSITDHQERKNIILESKNTIDMMNYIKDCIHEELEEIRRSLGGNKTNYNNNVNSFTWQKLQPSTHEKPADHNDSPDFYDIRTDAKNIKLKCPLDNKTHENPADHNDSPDFYDIKTDSKNIKLKCLLDSKTHENPADYNDSPDFHDIETDTKNIKLECPLDNKVQNMNYDKPSEPVCQGNTFAFLGRFRNFIYKDVLGTFSEQNVNIPYETDSKTKTNEQTYDKPTAIHGVCSITKTNKNHTISDRTMHTNVCEILPGNIAEQQNGTFPNNRITKEKYDQSSAFSGNVKPTTRSYEKSADKLTAQIMDVPYKLFKKITRLETKPVEPMGLLQKVKEVYAACNCKICECISTSPTAINTNSKTCNCKPCDCSDCRAMNIYSLSKQNKYRIDNTINKYQQKKSHSNSTECHCKPCDCIKCKKEILQKPCGCKPCKCAECKSMRLYQQTNFIVASVRDNQERPYCSCSPCGCFDCAHPLGTAVPTHFSQETGTDDRRHVNCNCDNCVNDNCEQDGLDTCNCERRAKLMSKPVTSDKKEFDIHYFSHKTTNVKSFLDPLYKKENAISIYTSLTHQIYCPPRQTRPIVYNNLNSANYLKRASTVSSRIASMQPQIYWELRRKTALMSKTSRDCNCKPCECQKCKQHFLEGHIPYRRGSSCEVCECINCATLSVSYDMERKYSKKQCDPATSQLCSCRPCECFDCTKYMIKSVHNRLYDNTFLNDNTKNLVNGNTRSKRMLKLLRASDSEHYIDMILSDKETKNRSLDNDKCDSSRTPTILNDSENMKFNDTDVRNNKDNIYINQEHHNNPEYRPEELENYDVIYHSGKHRYNTNDRDSTGINSHRTVRLNSTVVAGAASLEPKHYISRFREQPKKQESSPDSSYNSIDHYSSDYLLLEPTSTVETCINDVMNLRQYHKTNSYSKPKVISKTNKTNLGSPSNVLKSYNNFPLFGLNVMDDNSLVQIVDNNNEMYHNFNTDKSFQCKLCDCGDCSYKLTKLNSCQFDSTACGCDGIYYNENVIVIRQNESTQTAKFALNSDEHNMSKNFPSLIKKWNVSFSDDDRIIRWTDISTENYLNNTMSSTARTERPAMNYDSVRRTIKEAKQFSLQLLNILQKYEQANKDFDKLAIKFKEIQEPVISEIVELAKLDHATSIDNFSYDQSVSTIESIKVSSDDPSDISKSDEHEIDSHYVLNTNVQSSINKQVTKENSNERKDKNEENINEENAEPNMEIDQNIIKDDDKRNETDVNISTTINKIPVQQSDEKDNLEKLKIEFKEYSQHLDKVVDKCGKNIWRVRDSSTAAFLNKPMSDKKSISQDQKTDIPQNCELLVKGPSSIEKSIDKDSSDLNTVFICNSHKDHDNKELKSNILIHQQMDSFTVSTKMDAHITRSFKATQMSHTSRDTQSQIRSCRIFDSAPSMGSKRLLDWMARSTADTSITSHLTHNSSSQNPLKVIFQTVRVLSDHSILLKWKVPEDTSSIEGYEILVDGRSVQKILSPNKNIAALSCLPHADKLKLTVRTLTKPPAPAGPLPSATIVVSTRP